MNRIAFFLILTFFFAAGCVPAQRFKEVSDKSSKLEEERDRLLKNNEKLTVDNTEIKANFDKVTEERRHFIEDSIRQFQTLDGLKKDNEKLSLKYNDLL